MCPIGKSQLTAKTATAVTLLLAGLLGGCGNDNSTAISDTHVGAPTAPGSSSGGSKSSSSGGGGGSRGGGGGSISGGGGGKGRLGSDDDPSGRFGRLAPEDQARIRERCDKTWSDKEWRKACEEVAAKYNEPLSGPGGDIMTGSTGPR